MANLYNLKRFDLNLLIIFECIYQHLSISMAAKTLFITPSAVSQSLQRLRVQLNDPLFIRAGKGITPTTVAVNLHLHLESNLNQIEKTINISEGNGLKKKVIVYGPPFYVDEKIIKFMNTLLQNNNLEIEYHDMFSLTEGVEDAMNYRKADVIFTLSPSHDHTLVCVPFCECPGILVCRKEHPRLGGQATLEEILQERFALLQANDCGIKKAQLVHNLPHSLANRDIAFSSPSLMAIINIIRSSDLIGFIPQKTFDLLESALNLKEVIIPFTPPSYTIYLVYNRASINAKAFTEAINKLEA